MQKTSSYPAIYSIEAAGKVDPISPHFRLLKVTSGCASICRIIVGLPSVAFCVYQGCLVSRVFALKYRYSRIRKRIYSRKVQPLRRQASS